MSEQHLKGRSVTVVYRITDPEEWRKTNPLKYKHHGLDAYACAAGDLMEKVDALEDFVRSSGHDPECIYSNVRDHRHLPVARQMPGA